MALVISSSFVRLRCCLLHGSRRLLLGAENALTPYARSLTSGATVTLSSGRHATCHEKKCISISCHVGSSFPSNFSTKRTLSTNPSERGDSGAEDDEELSFLQRTQKSLMSTVLTPQNQFYALLAGGSIGAFVVSRGILSFTSFFTHLTPTTIAKWGFYTGFGTATCCHA